jgi:hypothetical protein
MGTALELLLRKGDRAKAEASYRAHRTSAGAGLRDKSLWIKRNFDLLSMVETSDDSIEYAATTVGVTLNDARMTVKAAEYLSALKSG